MPSWSIMFWRSCWAVSVTGGAAKEGPASISPATKAKIFFIASSLKKRKRNGGSQGAIPRGRQMQSVAGIISGCQMIGAGGIAHRRVEIQHRVEMAANPAIHGDAVGLGDRFGMIGR